MTALFVAAHPDDEILAMGVAIAEHVVAGQDVHVLVATAGEASGVLAYLNGTTTSGWWGRLHAPSAEGYQTLAGTDLGVLRQAETAAAVRQLASPGSVTLHLGAMPDGGVTVAGAYDLIWQTAQAIAPGQPVKLKGHTWLVDNHADHVAIGEAMRKLGADFPALYADIRYYVESPYWGDARLGQVAESYDTPASPDITARVRNAIRCFGAWVPPHSLAVGYHSVAGMLDQMYANPRNMVHT